LNHPQSLRKFLPTLNRVLVDKALAPAKSAAGILLPNADKSNTATVVAVGPGLRNQEGKTIPPVVKVGHDVLLPEYGGVEVKLDAKSYFLYREDDILAVLNNSSE
jgi:chaperonin GroES